MAINVTVRNLARAEAKGAKVTGIVRVDGNQIDKREFTVDVAALGAATVRWSKQAPRGRQFSVEMSVSHSLDAATGNNRATAAVGIAE